jgi:hypothetical protein
VENLVLWSPAETARVLRVSVQTLAIWRCSERYPLPYVKIGSRVRYRPADVAQFTERYRRAPVAQ